MDKQVSAYVTLVSILLVKASHKISPDSRGSRKTLILDERICKLCDHFVIYHKT